MPYKKIEMTPQAEELANVLRHNCLLCNAAESKTTRIVCSTKSCKMWPAMHRKFRLSYDDLIKAARAYCLDCMGDSKKLVRDCQQTDCLLYEYRDMRAMEDAAKDRHKRGRRDGKQDN